MVRYLNFHNSSFALRYNVLAFISKLGPNNKKAKNAQNWPQVKFSGLTES
jgi:hypothetical protein